MSILVSVATMADQRRPFPASPTISPVSGRRHTERLLGFAGVLTSDDDQKLLERAFRGPTDTSGIVSHLRASSSRSDKAATAISSTLSHHIRALTPYSGTSSIISTLNPFSSRLLSSNATALAQVLAARPSVSLMSAGFLPSAGIPISRLPGFGLGSHTFEQDPRLITARLGAAASALAASSRSVRRDPVVLFMDCDEDSLSEYQCLIRKQIELFEADKEEAASSVQGRNKQVVEGQVGIRCRHCSVVPPRQRQKGCMYFPTKLDRIYQAAQNLSAFHLCEHCKHVPEDVRKKILVLRERKSPAGGGKRYWAEGVRCQGVYEDSTGLRFRKF